jgi:hypothetical protein
MTKPKTKPEAKSEPKPEPAAASVSSMPKGSGSRRVQTRVITLYGPFKTRKTGCLSYLPLGRTKWITSDPNCVPTLSALGRLPHPDDLYEVTSLEALREFLEDTLKLAEKALEEKKDPRKVLGIDFLVLDSWTQFFDWHQQFLTKATNQRYMGESTDNNGWQRFNAEFGECLDLWAALGRYITVISIVHAKDKFDPKKGEFASFSLSPAMAQKLGRLSNWILFKGFTQVLDDDEIVRIKDLIEKDDPEGDYFTLVEERGETKAYEEILYTKPAHGFVASVNSLKLRSEEPGRDLLALLEKDGLWAEA